MTWLWCLRPMGIKLSLMQQQLWWPGRYENIPIFMENNNGHVIGHYKNQCSRTILKREGLRITRHIIPHRLSNLWFEEKNLCFIIEQTWMDSPSYISRDKSVGKQFNTIYFNTTCPKTRPLLMRP